MIYDRDILVNNINILINDNGITQSDLAQIIGTHQSRLSECLNRKKDFTLPQVAAIAHYFGTSVDDLLGSPQKIHYTFDSLSDVCSMLFALADNVSLHISHEYAEGGEYHPDDIINNDIFNDIGNIPDNDSDIPSSKGNLCITFDNKNVLAFLDEWHNAQKVLSLSNGNTLYNTWKDGAMAKYSHNLKKYSYKTKSELQLELADEKLRYCNAVQNQTPNELDKRSKEFDKLLDTTSRQILQEYEKEIGDLFSLPFAPDVRSKAKTTKKIAT